MSQNTRPNPLLDLPHETILLDGEPLYKQLFETVKEDVEYMSMQEAKMLQLGKLTDLLPENYFEGAISPKARLSEGKITQAGKEQADEALRYCYVPATKGASLRCVDGRSEVGYDDEDPKWYEIGPQVQGGTADIAVARRLRLGVHPEDTLEADVDSIIPATSRDYLPAGHTDDHPRVQGLGCGAINGQETKLTYYGDSEKLEAINKILQTVYEKVGGKLPDDVFVDLGQNAAELHALAPTYYANKSAILEHLEKANPAAKKIVTGQHNEYKVVINFVPGTTLNTSKFNQLTESEYQAFGLDAWYVLETCGEDAPFVLADALATLMNLTDGSVEVALRTAA